MDGLIFIIVALVFVFLDTKTVEDGNTDTADIVLEDTKRVAKVNDYYYDDPNAFCLIINNLGFPKGRS